MLLEQYESTEVDRNTCLHVPSGTYGPPAVTLTKWLKYKRMISTDIDTPF